MQKIFSHIWLLFFLTILIILNPKSSTGEPSSMHLSYDAVKEEVTVTKEWLWRYHEGDDPLWSASNFDDSSWQYVDSRINMVDSPISDWRGIGWFRMPLEVDSSLWNHPLALELEYSGACQVFMDGKLLYSLGKPGRSVDEEDAPYYPQKKILPIQFSDTTSHLLAVRYSNNKADILRKFNAHIGFSIDFKDLINFEESIIGNSIRNTAQLMIIIGLSVALGLLHILLFVFFPRLNQNIWIALLAFFMAGLTLTEFAQLDIANASEFFFTYYIFKFCLLGITVTGLRLVYSLFYTKMPVQFWPVLGVAVLFLILIRGLNHQYLLVFALLVIVEELRIVIRALIQRRSGVWILAIGFIIVCLGSGYQMLESLDKTGVLPFIPMIYIWGILGLLLAMSIYLARSVALTNKDLLVKIEDVKKLSELALEKEREAKKQEIERLRLEEENKRHEQELHEARKRQQVLDELERTHEKLSQAYKHLNETQAQLLQSEKMASLGMLVAGVAHEINTPVGAVHSMHGTLMSATEKLKDEMKELLKKCGDESDEYEKLIKVIDEANKVISSGTQRVTEIVSRLKSFARLDRSDLMKVDIHEGIEDTLALVNHELRNKVEVIRNFGDIPPIHCYPAQLNQVYVNLLINALHAIEDKGTITISTFMKDENVHIRFEDTGTGITKEHLDKIFDPGFTTKGVGVGTGLGLSICYQIISDHQGQILVESEVGKGTQITLIIDSNLDISVRKDVS
ncbi:MAG: ATP-binding protein [Candidatus Electryonea clarkiae]|nr:ATP-binding protein [Candidatus Electryonea clarkiae]MDP8285899.1 ATP-binding protein [Candidatus Electryonea clarkiae]